MFLSSLNILYYVLLGTFSLDVNRYKFYRANLVVVVVKYYRLWPYVTKDMGATSRRNVFARGHVLAVAALSGILLLFLTALAYSKNLTGSDSPSCRMVFMEPSYARIEAFDENHTKYASKYSLYLYRELGKDVIPSEDNNFMLDGIPILFIPGNAGSYRQVRSVAAETSNMYFEEMSNEERINNPHVRNYDFFAADFNEDFTAFHGRTLLDQAEYLNEAVKFILGLYQNQENPPKSVVILGHSMGGVVARAMLTLPNYVPDSINTLITLASPHAAAPLTFDGDMLTIYSAIDRFWFDGFADEQNNHIAKVAHSRLANISLISITGGLLDTILPADYTTLGYMLPSSNGFTVYTTGIPEVWTPMDHLAIVWCAQLRRKVLTLLLQIADFQSPFRTYPLDTRIEIFKSGLLSGFEDYAFEDSDIYRRTSSKVSLRLDTSNIKWYGLGDILKIDQSDATQKSELWKVFSIPKNTSSSFSVVTSSDIRDWKSLDSEKPSGHTVLLCKANVDENVDSVYLDFTEDSTIDFKEFFCLDASANTHKTPFSSSQIDETADSSFGGDFSPFETLQFNHSTLNDFDFIIITTPHETHHTSESNSFLLASLEEQSDSLTSLNGSVPSMAFLGVDFEEKRATTPMHRTIKIPNAWSSLIAYKLKFRISSKEGITTEPVFTPFVRQWSDDPYETKWHLNVAKNPEILLTMHGIAPYTPFLIRSDRDRGVNLDIWVDPTTTKFEQVSLSIDFYDSLRLLVLRYRLALVAINVSTIFLVFMYQVNHNRKYDKFPSFMEGMLSICNFNTLSIIFIFLLILTPVTRIGFIQNVLNIIDPVVLRDRNEINLSLHHRYKLNSFFLGLEENYLFFLGPIFFLMSIGITTLTYLTVFAICAGVVWFIRLFGKAFFSTKEQEAATGPRKVVLDRRSVGIIVLLIAVSFYYPYQLGYLTACVIQALQVIRVAARTKHDGNELNYHLAFLMIMLWVLPINIPVLVQYVHDFNVNWKMPFSSHHNCLSILPILLLTRRYSENTAVPLFKGGAFKATAAIAAYIIFYSLVYGIRHTFWIHHLFNFLCCCILTVHYINTESDQDQ